MIHEAIIKTSSIDSCRSFSGSIELAGLEFPYELTFPESLNVSLRRESIIPDEISDEAQLTFRNINNGPIHLHDEIVQALGFGFYELLIEAAMEYTKDSLQNDFRDTESRQSRQMCELTPEGIDALVILSRSRVENV